jgi:hypothetical protein
VITAVAVEKLAHFDFAKTASRQEALQTIFPSAQDIFYHPIFDFFQKNRLFQQSPDLSTSAKRREWLFGLGDELGDFGVGAYRLDEQNLLGVEVHAIGLVQFPAALDEDVVRLLSFGIRLRDDVIDFAQHGLIAAVALQVTEVNGAVGEQHRLVGRGKLNVMLVEAIDEVPRGRGDYRNSRQNPNELQKRETSESSLHDRLHERKFQYTCDVQG